MSRSKCSRPTGRRSGQLFHDPFSDAVSWEIAPGRSDVGPGAGPTDDPDVTRHRVGWIAAGLVAADATARQGRPGPSRDRIGVVGDVARDRHDAVERRPVRHARQRAHRGSGRPADRRRRGAARARRATRRRPGRVPDPDDLHDGRAAAYDALNALDLTVRLGELTRSDDSLLGYFVDDDYSHFHVVDRVIVANALPSGRLHGVVALDGTSPVTPVPIDHPVCRPHGRVAHPSGTDRAPDTADASGRPGEPDVRHPGAYGARPGARLGAAGPRGARAVTAHRTAPDRRGQGPLAEDRVVPSRAAVHPARYAVVVARRSDPRGHASGAAVRSATRSAGGLGPHRPEPARAQGPGPRSKP